MNSNRFNIIKLKKNTPTQLFFQFQKASPFVSFSVSFKNSYITNCKIRLNNYHKRFERFFSLFLIFYNSVKPLNSQISSAEKFFIFTALFYLLLQPYTIMNKTYILLIFLIITTLVSSAGIAPCPRQYQVGSVLSAQVTVSNQRGLIPLVDGQDVQCYNYSLPYKFSRVPQVAIAVHGFDSQKGDDLFFAIKPIQSEGQGFILFVVRTHWKYTHWNRISFSFIAEDRPDVETGYYQVDAGSLEGCEVGKKIQALMPFREIMGRGQVKYNLYLHGFQISTQNFSAVEKSPFEIQIAASSANVSGISVLFTVTTMTQVHAIHVSYFAFYETTLNLVYGHYEYDAFYGGLIEYVPPENIGRNYARLHGISGFIINYNSQDVSFDVKWTGAKFIFDLGISQRFTKYLQYSYLFLIGSQCSDCPGFPIIHEGKCVNTCPINYFVTPESLCLTCGDGQNWNGTACQKTCASGQFLNTATNQCECPAGLHWNGQICISCNSGKVFNLKTNLCECPTGLRWNGYGCANVPQCFSGRQWNVYTYSCQCPLGLKWNGTFCSGIKNCLNGKILNSRQECVCPDNTFWNGNWCQDAGCTGGQSWNGSECVCSKGLNFNGTICLECINGQIWNERSKRCQCESGYSWNGDFCRKVHRCSGGRVYNETFQQCVCKQGKFWNGFACMIQPQCCCGKRWNPKTFECECPSNFNWDNNACVQCINGKVWDEPTSTCVCLPGTQWNGHFCVVIQQCQGGMMWNQNTWTCECPSTTVWNGNYCIANPCSGGKIWDNFNKSCLCFGGKIFFKGSCVPPEVSCSSGQIWDEDIYACRCPDGTWFNGNSCEKITVCMSNQIYNPLNNKCQCSPGFIWLSAKNSCGDPTCQIGQRWDGHGCVEIACPPGSYYNGTQCICPGPNQQKCEPWEYFNGVECVYFPQQCPLGTQWNKTTCVPINSCLVGFYGENNHCKPFPQKCAPTTFWIEDQQICKPKSGNCPSGTYLSGQSCQPYVPCQNGQSWNPNRFMCLCPDNTEWNGNRCLPCLGGKVWEIGKGCQCPSGTFFSGSQCQKVDRIRCTNIPNSLWRSGKCQCKQGFSVVGMQCLCEGVIISGKCDRCAYLPNSEWNFGRCQCLTGYTMHYGNCVPNSPGNDQPSSCNVGTFFDYQQRKCLACPDGCLTCKDCYSCIQCQPKFNYDPDSELCIEHCGDGYKFNLQCDDGNNDDGDGCSLDCMIEPGYTCRGGSPNNKDSCIIYQPNEISITQTGQIRYQTKIVLNIKVDYLPQALLQSTQCNDRCSSIIIAEIQSGDTGAHSIKSTYIPGSSYSFSVQIDFGRSYIGLFNVKLSINPVVGAKFFGNVGTSNPLFVDVNPAYLSKAEQNESDVLS